MSESLIIKVKETSLPDFRLEKIDWKIDPSRRNDTRWSTWSWSLVDPVDDEDLRPRTDLQTNDNARSKETEEY
jgi:hypothetical protein